MPAICSALAQIQIDSNIMNNTRNIASADMNGCDYKKELDVAQANVMEVTAALENLVKGIQAVKRILEQPIDSEEYGDSVSAFESPDPKLVSNLSDKLVGILGSELLGLLNAAQMTRDHAKLRVEDERNAIQDLHNASEFARALNYRVDNAERRSLRLTAEKKLLVKEVRSLRADRQLLTKEVKSLHKIVQCSKQFDDWRLLEEHVRAAMAVHESVLSNKTFQSGFAGIDPPGIKVRKDIDMKDKFNNIIDHTNTFLASEKENIVQHAYLPRKESQGYEAGNSIDKALKYTKGNHRQVKLTSESKYSPKPTSNPTPSKKRGLPFRTGFSNSLTTGLGRFKNALQEASDQMRYNEDYDVEQASRDENYDRERTSIQCQYHPPTNVEKKLLKVKRNENDKEKDKNNNSITSDCMTLDDEATTTTKSCSFEMETLNLSSSAINCSDDGTTNDHASQISIDGGSSLLDTISFDGFACTSSFSPPALMITPDSSPLARQSTKVFLKPRCSPNVLRTLAMPNGNTLRETITSRELKSQPRSFLLRR